MRLSWNEIKSRAIAFSKDWSAETSERAGALLEAERFKDQGFVDPVVFGHVARRIAGKEAILDDLRANVGIEQHRPAEGERGVDHHELRLIGKHRRGTAGGE